MDFSQFIGFLISIVAIIFMFKKNKNDDMERSTRADGDEESSNTLEEFLKSLEDDLDASKDFKKLEEKAIKQNERKVEVKKVQIRNVPPPVPKSVVKSKKQNLNSDFRFKTNMDAFKSVSNIEKREFFEREDNTGEHLLSEKFKKEYRDDFISKKNVTTKANNILKKIPSKKDLIVIHEIFSPPKGMF